MRTSRIISALTALCLALLLASCSQQKAETPSYKNAVKQAMDQNGFNKVTVDEDRDKGVVTLGGKVQSDDEKARAEEAAKTAAPGAVIAMERLSTTLKPRSLATSWKTRRSTTRPRTAC
ncbi:MAG: hypothetical protein DMG67_11500 [Acidobacteria bacterium]|nr:MAG: hypothetical protein DMG67_11500 [Acidobacteriota bacterium]